MTVGERIKVARERKKLTQEELGAMCGTTKQSVFKYEAGVVTNIPLDRLERIASALDVTTAYLMGWEEEKPAAPASGGPKERAHQMLDQLPEDKLEQAVSYLEFLKSQRDKQ